MSNAFRTPGLDTLRTIMSNLIPWGKGDVFSLRQYRSLLSCLWELRSAQASKCAESTVRRMTDLVGVIDARIVGTGFWFRKWSPWLRSRVKTVLKSRPELMGRLPASAPFVSPLEVVALRRGIEFSGLENEVNNLKRLMATVFLKFPKLYFHPNEVKGLQFQRKRLECHSPSKWGQYEIRCDGNGRDFASYIMNRSTRERILREYNKVFNESNEFHDAILRVLRERKRLAESLGFPSWSEMQSSMNGYQAWLNDEYGGSSISFLEHLYQKGQPRLKKSISRMRAFKSDIDNPRRPPDSIDEQYLITASRSLLDFKKPQIFEYKKVTDKILRYFERVFDVTFTDETSSLTYHGWHKDVRILAIRSGNCILGRVYLDLFRRPMATGLAGAGPHCSVLMPSDEHVRIFMGLHPPYRSDVTFKKERFLTIEEVTALMHEFGHALHIFLRPRGSPISQLPIDMRESISVLCELFSFTDKFLDFVSDKKLTVSDKNLLRRDEWFYVDIIRNIAVAEYLHSSQFDPEKADADRLISASRAIFSKFSPFDVSDFVNPLAGELSSYLLDGESRIGYLVSYARAASAITNTSCTNDHDRSIADVFMRSIISKTFHPLASSALESNLDQSPIITGHPLPLPRRNPPSSDPNCASIWEVCAKTR